jgi:2,3-bisphosphoglycerate-independent phosphoglycerate mutase
MVNSPKVATYDLKPEMSAMEVKDKILAALDKEYYDLLIINLANCDMVGHTGVYPAIIKAVETVDSCCAEIVSKILDQEGTVIITADHGNAEQTRLEDNSPMTSHTKNPVPLSLISGKHRPIRERGQLCDVAPTILELLNLPIPEDMTGRSLLIK